MMESEISTDTNLKKRRIMIITGDDSVIEQLQSNANSSLFKSIIIETQEDEDDQSYSISNEQKDILNHKRHKKSSLTCVVCGAAALGYNFDAITCESCKAFFRRNALKDEESLQCKRKGSCEITSETRRRCSACRLMKCLSCGMKRERLIRTAEKEFKRLKIEENRHLTLQKLDPVEEEQLSSWPLLSESNEDNILDRLTDLIDIQSESPAGRALLTTEDLQRVETIQTSYDQRIELAARDGLPWNPSTYVTTILQHINSRSVPAIRLLTFFKQIPEFNQLNVDDKVILIKYNLMPLIILNGTLAYKIETDQILETESDKPWDSNIFQAIHGDEVFMKVKKIFYSFVRIAQYDPRIIQLALIVLILTKGFATDLDAIEPPLRDSLAVRNANTYYTELLWKYMETVHGYEKSTRIFYELVVQFISWQTLEIQLRINMRKILSPSDMNKLLPIMKSLLHIT